MSDNSAFGGDDKSQSVISQDNENKDNQNGVQPDGGLQGNPTPSHNSETQEQLAKIEKRLADKDAFIEKITEENAAMREEITKLTSTLDEKLAAVTNKSDEGNSTKVEPSDISSIVQDELSKHALQKQREANFQSVDQALIKHFGDVERAQQAVTKRASELGMTAQDLKDQAMSNPKAVLALMGAESKVDYSNQGQSQSPGGSSVNTAGNGMGETNVRNYAYYEMMRKEIGMAEFFKPKVQNQLMKDRDALGDKFYS